MTDNDWFEAIDEDFDNPEFLKFLEERLSEPFTVEEYVQAHRMQFGDVVNFFSLRGILTDEQLVEAIQKALQNEQPLSDSEYGSKIPEGLDS